MSEAKRNGKIIKYTHTQARAGEECMRGTHTNTQTHTHSHARGRWMPIKPILEPQLRRRTKDLEWKATFTGNQQKTLVEIINALKKANTHTHAHHRTRRWMKNARSHRNVHTHAYIYANILTSLQAVSRPGSAVRGSGRRGLILFFKVWKVFSFIATS